MIKPELREKMVAFNAGAFSVRLWVNPGGADIAPIIELLKAVAPPFNHAQEHVDEMERLLTEQFNPEHQITAYEIVGFDRCGVVGYIEWP